MAAAVGSGPHAGNAPLPFLLPPGQKQKRGDVEEKKAEDWRLFCPRFSTKERQKKKRAREERNHRVMGSGAQPGPQAIKPARNSAE